jgi:hypothetical protein
MDIIYDIAGRFDEYRIIKKTLEDKLVRVVCCGIDIDIYDVMEECRIKSLHNEWAHIT